MLFGDNKNMDPEDLSRLFIFFVCAVFIYIFYNHFVIMPQNQAIREAAKYDAMMAKQEAAIAALDEAPKEAPKSRKEIIAQAKEQRIPIDNGGLFGSISTKGANIDDITLHNYYETLEKKEHIATLSPKGSELPRYINFGWVAAEQDTILPDAETIWSAPENSKITADNPVTLKWNNGNGLTFERTIALDENFMFTITQKVTNNSGKKVTLYPYGLFTQTGIPKDLETTWIQHAGPIAYTSETLHEISYKSLREDRKKEMESNHGWIGITDKYWYTSLIPPQGQDVKYSFKYTGKHDDKDRKGRYQADFIAAPLTLDAGQSGEVKSHVFSGAKRVLLMNKYRDELGIPKFDLAVNFGWFWFMSKPFFLALHYLGELTGNVGIAIILLTIIIRGSVFPLTNASYKSFAKMKKVSPQVAELRENYADDKQKLQTEIMNLYQREGVNPMAGCFPILLQIPIFFALYKVLFITIEIRHAPFFGWIQDLSAPDPTTLFNLFGLIDWTPPSYFMVGVWPCLMCATMLVQKKLNPPPQDQLQRDMANIFPIAMTFVLGKFASGLVIYWTFSAFIGLIQQMIIMRSMNVPIYLFGQSEDEKKIEDSVAKGKTDIHPLIAMAEEEMEEALFDDEPPKPIKPIKPKKKKKKK